MLCYVISQKLVNDRWSLIKQTAERPQISHRAMWRESGGAPQRAPVSTRQCYRSQKSSKYVSSRKCFIYIPALVQRNKYRCEILAKYFSIKYTKRSPSENDQWSDERVSKLRPLQLGHAYWPGWQPIVAGYLFLARFDEQNINNNTTSTCKSCQAVACFIHGPWFHPMSRGVRSVKISVRYQPHSFIHSFIHSYSCETSWQPQLYNDKIYKT